MKVRSALLAILALAFTSTGSFAATYDITSTPYGTNDSPVLFSAPGTGTITLGATAPGNLFPIASQVFGKLAANTLVTFTYNLASFTTTPFLQFPVLVGTSDGNALSIVGNVDGATSFTTALIKVVASFAGIGGANPQAIITFQNLTGGTSPIFEADLYGAMKGLTGTVTVSSVPLPASLPLFLAGALVLGGLAYARRQQTL